MSKRNERKRAAPPAIYLVAALVAAIAGFGTVYVSFAPSDNGETENSETGPGGQGTGAGPLAGLNTGAMASLVVRPQPVDLPALTFTDADGQPKSLADFSGKIVLLNIWATWCVPCREEMPALDQLETKLGGKDFQVVAVNIDTRDPDKPKAWLKEVGVQKLAYYADPAAKSFQDLKSVGRAFGMPTTLLIDPKGCEIATIAGPAEWASDDAIKLINAAIGR